MREQLQCAGFGWLTGNTYRGWQEEHIPSPKMYECPKRGRNRNDESAKRVHSEHEHSATHSLLSQAIKERMESRDRYKIEKKCRQCNKKMQGQVDNQNMRLEKQQTRPESRK